MDTKGLADRKLHVPAVIQQATDADNVVRSVMKHKVVPLQETAYAIRNKRECVKKANKVYFPLSEENKTK